MIQDEPEVEGRFFAERKSCPVLCHSERVLLKLPWSVGFGSREQSLEIPDGRERRWIVSAGPAGWPTPFDHAVFRACEWVALERVVTKGRVMPASVLVGARDLCERLHLKETPASARAIDRSLSRLAGVELRESRGLLRRRLFSDVEPVRDDPGSTRALDLSYRLTFDRAYVQSVNGGHTLALNWQTWQDLDGPVPRRLMEILTCAFAQRGAASLGAQESARLIPLPRGTKGPKLQRLLDLAHEQLFDRNFISEARWTSSRSGPVVEYVAGSTHRSTLDRLRPPRSASLLAWELASELTDAADAGAYQDLVDRTDPRHILGALSEVRILRRQGIAIPDPRSFFLGRMRLSIERERRTHRLA